MEDDKSFVCKAEKVTAERACKPHARINVCAVREWKAPIADLQRQRGRTWSAVKIG